MYAPEPPWMASWRVREGLPGPSSMPSIPRFLSHRSFEIVQRPPSVDREPLQVRQRVAATDKSEAIASRVADQRKIDCITIEQQRDGIDRLELRATEIQGLLRAGNVRHRDVAQRGQTRAQPARLA